MHALASSLRLLSVAASVAVVAAVAFQTMVAFWKFICFKSFRYILSVYNSAYIYCHFRRRLCVNMQMHCAKFSRLLRLSLHTIFVQNTHTHIDARQRQF